MEHLCKTFRYTLRLGPPRLKLGNIRGYSPIFKTARVAGEKDLKDNKHNSLHLGRKYVRIFVLGHYLFLVAHSFPRATLSENCSLLGTDNVRGQISWHIFAPNGGYCLFIIQQIVTLSKYGHDALDICHP